MSNQYDDDFDDEAVRRSNLLTHLEGHTGPIDEDADGYALDDLDQADHVLGALDTSGASTNVGGLEGKVSLREKAWSNLNGVAPFVRISPPSALQGVLGGQQMVTSGQKITVANWAAAADAETLPVNITVAPVGQPLQVLDIAYAIIQFGTRGMSVLVEVDIGSGTDLTVGASAVSVQVALPAVNPNFPNFTTGPITRQLAGMLSFYTLNRGTPLTRTYIMASNINTYNFALTDGTFSAFSSPPPFARQATIYLGDVQTNSVQILVLSGGGPIATYTEILAPGTQRSTTFDIPGSTTAIQVVGLAGAAVNGFGSIVYDLSL